MKNNLRVLIVDDSVVFRKILNDALSKHRGINVVGSAVNGKDALQKIRCLKPELLVMDVEMPELDGLQTLDELKKQRIKVGVIMFSTLTSKGAKTTLDALSKGAFDFVPKPTGTGAFGESVRRIKAELIPKIEAYAQSISKVKAPLRRPSVRKPTAPTARLARVAAGSTASKPSPVRPPARPVVAHPTGFKPAAVAIGVSTGGPNALQEVIPKFPANFNLPLLLVQHMPPIFTTQLAKRLDDKSKLKVVEARDRQPVQGGTVYIAPGDYHMTVVKEGKNVIIRLNQDPPENSCRPAVDVLFRSVASVYGGRVVGVIMTGMGQDGLVGTRLLKEKGATVIAQDKESSVVWGMPKFVAEEGLADRVCNLKDIEPAILEFTGFAHRSAGPALRQTSSVTAR